MYHHNTQIDPIYKKGKSDAAVMLIHGFTATPDSMRFLANHLNSLGFTVSAPLLAGHGTTKENLAKTTWQDWYGSVQTHFKQLQEKFSNVYVAGLSLGALLSLKLAEDYPQSIRGIACLSTPLFLKPWVHLLVPLVHNTPIKHLYRYQKKFDLDVKNPEGKKNYWNINEIPISCVYSIIQLQKIVRSRLQKVTTPCLLLHSRYDATAPYNSMNAVANQISSRITETATFENSFHLLTIDYEKDLVNEKIGQFFLRFL